MAAGCSGPHKQSKPEPGPQGLVGTAPEADSSASQPIEGALDEARVSGADRGKTVTLAFNYPDNGSVNVEAHLSTHSAGQTSRMALGWQEVYSKQGDGLHIIKQHYRVLPVDDSAQARARAKRAQAVYNRTRKNSQQTLIVGPKAGIVGTKGIKSAYASMGNAVSSANPQMRKLAKRLGRALAKANSQGGHLRGEWVMFVEFWAGQSLEIGQKKSAHFTGPYVTTKRGAPKVTINVDYMATALVRCSPRDNERRCVRLRLSAVPDAQQLTLAARRYGATVRGALPDRLRRIIPEIRSMSSRTDLDLVVEPDTLRVRRVKRVIHDRLVLPGGKTYDTTTTAKRTYSY